VFSLKGEIYRGNGSRPLKLKFSMFRPDALGLAHLMRTGWFRQAHIKSEACYRLRLLLTHGAI
jgi:hypothetical protein